MMKTEKQIGLESRVKKSNNFNQLKKKLVSQSAKAIEQFDMIHDGDIIMVCLSGGKDSYTLLDILLHLQKRAPIRFKLIAMHLNQNQPGYDESILPCYMKNIAIPFELVCQNTYEVVIEKTPVNKTYCSLCSRLRRGAIYKTARKVGANKVALGHHANDILETFFLNLFYNGKLKAMGAKFKNDEGDIEVIRPLAFTFERQIIRYANAMKFPIIPCNLCGSQQGSQRQAIKKMIGEWDLSEKNRSKIIFSALKNVVPEHLLDTNFVISNKKIDNDKNALIRSSKFD